jgi:hypothetical protein
MKRSDELQLLDQFLMETDRDHLQLKGGVYTLFAIL